MKQYLCRKCGKEQLRLLKFMNFVGPTIMYCDNDECLLYGILTITGYVEEEEKKV